MIRDETRIPLAFRRPPSDDVQATERTQLMFEDPKRIEILRRASVAPPESDEEASDRIRAAGAYPTNLLGTWWNTSDELAKKLKEAGWVVETKPVKKYKGKTTANEIVVKSPDHGVLFLVVSKTKYGSTEVDCARVLYSSNEEWKREVNGDDDED